MFEAGLVTEVRKLLDMGYDRNIKSMQSIGYRHASRYIFGDWGLEEAIEQMARDTRRYAKRQYTWFRKDPQIIWFDPAQDKEISAQIANYLEQSA